MGFVLGTRVSRASRLDMSLPIVFAAVLLCTLSVLSLASGRPLADGNQATETAADVQVVDLEMELNGRHLLENRDPKKDKFPASGRKDTFSGKTFGGSFPSGAGGGSGNNKPGIGIGGIFNPKNGGGIPKNGGGSPKNGGGFGGIPFRGGRGRGNGNGPSGGGGSSPPPPSPPSPTAGSPPSGSGNGGGGGNGGNGVCIALVCNGSGNGGSGGGGGGGGKVTIP